MPYSKQTWVDGVAGGTPIDAEALTHIEDGIDAAHTAVDAANTAIAATNTALASVATDVVDLSTSVDNANTAISNANTAISEVDAAVDTVTAGLATTNAAVTAADAARVSGDALLESRAKRRIYAPRNQMKAPAHSEVPVYSAGIAADAAFNESYVISGGVLPNPWPIEAFGDMIVLGGLWSAKNSQGNWGSPFTARFMCDGSEICWISGTNLEINVYIDGQPYANNPILGGATSGLTGAGIQKLVFSSARPRLLEFRSMSGYTAFYTKKPYRIWKPTPDPNPRVAVVGDSYVTPTTLSNTTNTAHTPDPYMRGLYSDMAQDLGISSMVMDGINGTGYLQGGAPAMPYGHANRLAWLQRVNPDVIVVHGGGGNDFNNGATVADVAAAATTYFQALRTNHPNAKLVFMEGIAPPLFTPATFNPKYKQLRETLQTNLEALGIKAYYIDIATTRPPFSGTGYVTAPVANDNTSIYVGYDQTHYTELGAKYLRSIIAPKLRAVLADRGALEGTLIL